MKQQGGNKQRPNYLQWSWSFILEESNWNFVQVGYPVATSHFAVTPQSDIVRICAHGFQRHGDAFSMTENACFHAFITIRSQFHLHHCSQCQKSPPTLDLSFKSLYFHHVPWSNKMFCKHSFLMFFW